MSWLDVIGRATSAAGMLVPGRAGHVVSAIGEGLGLVGEIVRNSDAPDVEMIRLRGDMADRIERMRRYAAENARR